MTSRDLVKATLEFENKTGRVPRQMWTLPWAEIYAADMLHKIRRDFPDDISGAPGILASPTISKGDPYTVGTYVDEWGCVFTNIQSGVIGEVKTPLVKEEDWSDWENIHIPTELLSFDASRVNEFCKNSDKFIQAGCCPRPFEQLQFIRTTEELFVDLTDPPENLLKFMDKMFVFYCELMEKWAKTDVDFLMFMDDWGSQNSLIEEPEQRDFSYIALSLP